MLFLLQAHWQKLITKLSHANDLAALYPFFVQLFLNLASSNLLSKRPRMWLYRQLGVKMASGVSIGVNCQISQLHLSNIYLCCNVSINTQCHLEAGAEILIGEETCLAPGVRILTTTHQIGGSDRRTGYSFECRPVSIGAGCWICANVLILPGVVIPDGCVIAAGAVVTKPLPEPNCLYAGVPAQFVRKLPLHPKEAYKSALTPESSRYALLSSDVDR